MVSGNLFSQSSWCLPYRNENKKWVLVKEDGALLNGIEYDTVAFIGFRFQLIKVKLSGKWGLINSSGDIILPMSFNSIHYRKVNSHSKPYLLVTKQNDQKEDQFGLYSAKGEKIFEPKFREIKFILKRKKLIDEDTPIAIQLMDTSQSNNWGLYNFKGKQLLPHEYSGIKNLICNAYDKTEKSRCIYISQVNEAKEERGGVYNASIKKWVIPCPQIKYPDYSKEREHKSLGNYSSCQLLTEGEYFTIQLGQKLYNKYPKPEYGFYNMQGQMIYRWLDTLANAYPERTYYYVWNDSVVGETKRPSIFSICDSRKLKLLSFGETDAIFDLEKGFILEPDVYKKYGKFACDKDYMVFRDLAKNTNISLRMDGKVWKYEEPPITSETKFYKGSLLVRNDEGQVLDMSPYTIEKALKESKKYGEIFKAKHGGKSGIINKEKKIIKPFVYDYILDDSDGMFNTRNGQKKTLWDSELKKVVTSRNHGWGSMDMSDGSLITMNTDKRYKIYNLEKREFVLKKAQMPTKLDIDSLSYYNSFNRNYNIMHFVNDSTRLFQAFDARTGWTLYDSDGNKIMRTATKTYRQIRPIIRQGMLLGYIYPTEKELSTGMYNEYYQSNHYFFNNGLRFEKLDTLQYFYYIPKHDKYIVRNKLNEYIFDTKGNYINNFSSIHEIGYDLYKVRRNKRYNLCDSNFQELLPEFYDEIKRVNKNYIVTRKVEEKSVDQLVFIGDQINISRNYIYVRKVGIYYFGYLSNDTFEVLNTKAEILYKNGRQLKITNTYIIFEADGREYWMTTSGTIYASHEVKN